MATTNATRDPDARLAVIEEKQGQATTLHRTCVQRFVCELVVDAMGLHRLPHKCTVDWCS
jgi:hypothetical protein